MTVQELLKDIGEYVHSGELSLDSPVGVELYTLRHKGILSAGEFPDEPPAEVSELGMTSVMLPHSDNPGLRLMIAV